MSDGTPLIVISASARALAWSARRAGFEVLAVDQFGDVDLRDVASAVRVVSDWPGGIPAAVAELPDAPCVYGGGLENSPELIAGLAASRELLGCSTEALSLVRDPFAMASCWRKAGLTVPRLLPGDARPGSDGFWLRKSRRSAGGLSVRWGDAPATADDVLQEFIPGDVVSGLYLANGMDVRLLGMAEQLAGCAECGADEFLYCGSIWPAGCREERAAALRAGETAVRAAGLVGVFGIDFIRDAYGELTPLELNPRFPASAEQCERSTGWPMLRWHVEACRSGVLPTEQQLVKNASGSGQAEGKAVVYSPCEMTAPDLRQLAAQVLPANAAVADIPRPGSPLPAGAPVCSILMSAGSAEVCRSELLNLAARLRRELSGG